MDEVNKFENIYFFDILDSTNLCAQEFIKSKKINSNSLIVAKHQAAGKGQRGNKWLSNYGENLLFSMVWFPKYFPVDDVFYISKIISLALHDFIRCMTEGQVEIKWPNDIYCEGKKIAGILIENNISGSKISSSIIGVGVNINQKEFEKGLNATSVFQQTGKERKLTGLPFEFSGIFRKWYKNYRVLGKEVINSEYLNRLYAFGETRNYKNKEGEFKAKVIGVSERGLLQMEKIGGEVKYYSLKEVSFL